MEASWSAASRGSLYGDTRKAVILGYLDHNSCRSNLKVPRGGRPVHLLYGTAVQQLEAEGSRSKIEFGSTGPNPLACWPVFFSSFAACKYYLYILSPTPHFTFGSYNSSQMRHAVSQESGCDKRNSRNKRTSTAPLFFVRLCTDEGLVQEPVRVKEMMRTMGFQSRLRRPLSRIDRSLQGDDPSYDSSLCQQNTPAVSPSDRTDH